jgi:Holliday junction resolvase RusA-like endonuclease
VITYFVAGFPIPQGSLQQGKGGGLRYSNDFELKFWRDRVQEGTEAAMAQAGRATFTARVYLGLDFLFPPGSPIFGERKYDLDKLVRAVCDALTDAKAYNDDSQVTDLHAKKRIMPPDGRAGVAICLDLAGAEA